MISIIIPVHNKLPHLDRTIQSVMRQTFQEFELILIDDASTDGSEKKIHEYQDPRIKIFKRDVPGPGGYAARNLGIKEAKYDWIAFLDADDEWNENYLEEIIKAVGMFPKAKIISTDWQMKNENKIELQSVVSSEYYSSFDLLDYLEDTIYMWTSAIVVNKAITKNSSNFPAVGLCKRGGDVDTWVRWLYRSDFNIHINKVLATYYRDTVNQVTKKPNTLFCAFDTLKEIYRNEKNRKLRAAIKEFSDRFLYNMLNRQIRSGMRIDYSQMKKFSMRPSTIIKVIKLHIIWSMVLLNKK